MLYLDAASTAVFDNCIIHNDTKQRAYFAQGTLVMRDTTLELEKAVMDPRFHRDYYRYDPELMTDHPHFSHE